MSEEEKMEPLKKEYLASLPERIAEIEKSAETYISTGDKSAFQYTVHKLGGTIGYFGMQEAGNLLKEMDQRLIKNEDVKESIAGFITKLKELTSGL